MKRGDKTKILAKVFWCVFWS